MPFESIVESLCDSLGASIAYAIEKKSVKHAKDIENEYLKEKAWNDNRMKKCAMHPENKLFITTIINNLADYDSKHTKKETEIYMRKYLKYENLKMIYDSINLNLPRVIKISESIKYSS